MVCFHEWKVTGLHSNKPLLYDGECPVCGAPGLLGPEDVERWHLIPSQEEMDELCYSAPEQGGP